MHGMDVPSPCIRICTLDCDQVCVGCGRHLDEIANWSTAPSAVRLRILAAAQERLARRGVQYSSKAETK
jgi:predicted Fe-S protein YdhL (DUF1289 family)